MRWRPRHPLRCAFLGFGIAGPTLLVLIGARAGSALILLAGRPIDGKLGTLFNVYWFTALQKGGARRGALSRVSSWDYVGSLALYPVGLAMAGPVAGAIGVSTTLYGAAGLFGVLLCAVLAIPAVRNFRGEETAVATGLDADRARVQEVAVAVEMIECERRRPKGPRSRRSRATAARRARSTARPAAGTAGSSTGR